MDLSVRGILSPLRLPISPSRHFKELKETRVLQQIANLFVIPTGFEPVTYCLEGSCSNPLSYGTICLFVLYKCIIISRYKKIFREITGKFLSGYKGGRPLMRAALFFQML